MAENCIRFKVHSTNCNTRRTHGRSHHIFINAPHSHGGMRGHLLVRNCGDSVIVGNTLSSFSRIPILRFLPLSDAVLPAYKHHHYDVDLGLMQIAFQGQLRQMQSICRESPYFYDKPTKFLRFFQRKHKSPSEKKKELEITVISRSEGERLGMWRLAGCGWIHFPFISVRHP